MTTAVFSIAALEGICTALEGVRTAMDQIVNVQSEIADAIVPPGFDASSFQGAAQQKIRLNEFKQSFTLGMVELQRYIQEVQAAAQQIQIVDTEGAGNITLASPGWI